ncbi:site-specific DNA-methyltransferase [bacterium]|nr:MAG: site-specific DNA-methyltransferase [bacterium]
MNGKILKYLEDYSLKISVDLFAESTVGNTSKDYLESGGKKIPKYINEFWTSRQRQASRIHEISYRACFKAQLPRFFINLLTEEGDIVYDPFSGRGTTPIEAGLLDRNIISNDINPLSEILTKPRLFIPDFKEIGKRLIEIPLKNGNKADIDLSMFYHTDTEAEIVSIREYLKGRKENGAEDEIDAWIRMVVTNRLTGHSKGFFSVYTLPPNQATTPERQKKINEKRNQVPEYRDTRQIILRKSRSLLRGLTLNQVKSLRKAGEKGLFLTKDARETDEIKPDTVTLTVTSPPFLDIVQYAHDNWLRCWFNNIDPEEISRRITVTRKLEEWTYIMRRVFEELFRITKKGGWVAFEVGELRKGKIKLEEYVVPLGVDAGFKCECIIINQQDFTKTSNIWGINNNDIGTNTNRIVLFQKV